MTRTERIQLILQKRRGPAERLTTLVGRLDSLSQTLDALEGQRKTLLEDVALPSSARQGVADLNLFDSIVRVSDITAQARRLAAKFGRGTLNVGIVGQAGQGKSRLLQSLTGLTEGEIPTSNRNHCTGVCVRFVNRPGEVSGEVSFHAPSSFIADVLTAYYAADDGGLNLGPVPRSLDEFRTRPLPACRRLWSVGHPRRRPIST